MNRNIRPRHCPVREVSTRVFYAWRSEVGLKLICFKKRFKHSRRFLDRKKQPKILGIKISASTHLFLPFISLIFNNPFIKPIMRWLTGAFEHNRETQVDGCQNVLQHYYLLDTLVYWLPCPPRKYLKFRGYIVLCFAN